jgi:hypothetical protein
MLTDKKIAALISAMNQSSETFREIVADTISELDDKISELEDKQSERETDARGEKIEALTDKRDALQSFVDALENVETSEGTDALDKFNGEGD